MNRAAPGEQVRIEQIRSIYRTTTPGTLTTLITIFMLTVGLVYLDPALRSRATVFLSVMFVQSVARLGLYQAFSRLARESTNWRPWAFWFTVGTFAGGTTIGCGSIWLIAAEHTDLQLLAFMLIFAVTGGAVGAFAAYPPAFFVFFGAIGITPIIWLFSVGDPMHFTIGVVFVLWFMAVAEQARRAGLQFIDSIRLRLEKAALAEDLRLEKAVAEEANIAKSRFLAAASHDLRQPVHALSVFVGALRGHAMDANARGLLDHIDGSVRALSGLFEGLLDISRLDAGVVEVSRVSFAIQPLIERVCHDYESRAKAKGVELRYRPTRSVVFTDPMLFERILRNMVLNAVTYTDRGKVLVGCRHGAQLRVEVWDTGRGIAPEEQARVFQEFYQIGNPERDRTRGVGLGLAIVKRLTTLLDHRLELRSWPGKGTCFSVDLPRASALPLGSPTAIPVATRSITPGSGLILVVDDEGAIQTAMRSLLESWGYTVIAAGSYAEAMAQIATCPEHPRLIICDYRLRDNETGSMVIERLRNEYNDSIPGMLITGDTAPDRIKEAEASGYLLLHKPVPNEVLREAIARLITPAVH